jgi:hypothetical protein
MDVRGILTDAALELGILDPSEGIDAAKAAQGLRILNRMLSAWADEDLMIITKDRLTFNLVANQQSYTIGVGGNFNTPYPVRPGQIDLVSVMFNNVEIPIDILNDEQWRDISLKTTPSTFPLQVWANGNYPLDVLYFWPVPTTPNQLVMTVWGQIVAFADVNASISVPQGYEEAIVLNLAVRWAPSWGVQASPTTIQLANAAKARIKAMNWEPTYRTVDSALAGSHNNIGQRSRGYVVD